MWEESSTVIGQCITLLLFTYVVDDTLNILQTKYFKKIF